MKKEGNGLEDEEVKKDGDKLKEGVKEEGV